MYFVLVDGIIIPEISTTTATSFLSNLTIFDFLLIGFILQLIIIPGGIIIWMKYNQRWVVDNFPKINAWIVKSYSESKQVTFHNTDIVDNKAIIPVFDNIFMNYKCYGEFGRHLRKVEILELPFNFILQDGAMIFGERYLRGLIRKNKRIKERNDVLFRAVFYFDQVPTSGRMDVMFI